MKLDATERNAQPESRSDAARRAYFAAERPLRKPLFEFGIVFPDMMSAYLRHKFGVRTRRDLSELDWLTAAATCRAAARCPAVLRELAYAVTTSPAGELAWDIGSLLPEPVLFRLILAAGAGGDASTKKLQAFWENRRNAEFIARRAGDLTGQPFAAIRLNVLDDGEWFDCVSRLLVDEWTWRNVPDYRETVAEYLRQAREKRAA